MAAEWIKWSKGLARKPEVMQIAHRLGVSRHAAAGILMEVWEWADDNVVIDDAASGFDPDDCPGSVRLGDQSPSLFDATFGVPGLADAMTAVGWIAIRSGSLVFPNFARHNGKSAKARALDSARKRTARQSGPARVPKPSGSRPDKTRIKGEEKREEGREEVPASPATGKTTAPPRPPPEPRKPAVGDHPETVAYFCDRWKAKYRTDYPFRSKDGKHVADLLKLAGGAEKLRGVMARFLADDDPFHAADSRHDLGALVRGYKRWLVDAPPLPPKGGPRTKADRDLDYVADQFADVLGKGEP